MMDKNKKAVSSILFGVISFLLLTILDQLTKQWAVLFLKDREAIVLIDGVFQLNYLENHGAAFGILQGQQTVFFVITIVILAAIVYCYLKLPFLRKYRWIRVFFVLIAAGAVGNFIDRMTNQYVVDFFYFNLINFPIFNVADIYVTCSTLLLVVFVLFKMKDEDFTEITKSLRLKKDKGQSDATGI